MQSRQGSEKSAPCRSHRGGSATKPAEGPRARVSAGVLVSVACRRGRQES